MRSIRDHVINPTNDKLEIEVLDEPGPGGANHDYVIRVPRNDGVRSNYSICFQKGGIAEVGMNGVTQEALLAIVIDRLRSFQDGPFPSRENAIALMKCEEALHWLQQRTLERMRRGVEGKQVA